MNDHTSTASAASLTLTETLPSVALLLGGVPLMTVLVMTAARYVTSGTF